MKVKLVSNEKKAAEATDRTIRDFLGGACLKRGDDGEILFNENGLATVEGGNEGYLRYALVRQGFVLEIATGGRA